MSPYMMIQALDSKAPAPAKTSPFVLSQSPRHRDSHAAFSDSPEQAHVRSQAPSIPSDPTHHSDPMRKSGSEQPPPKKRKVQQELVAGSLPRCAPLPAARGGIKQVCENGKTDGRRKGARKCAEKTNKHGLHPIVERRLKPPTQVRTTLRVATLADMSKKVFWTEVRAAESPVHEQIIRDIASAIRKGDVSSKESAQKMQAKLLRQAG